MDKKNNAVIYGEIVAKCWEDEAYKKRFIADPEGVLTDAGFTVEEGVEYKVIEAPKNVIYAVIPFEGAKDAAQLLARGILDKAEKDEVIVPEGFEVRIVQNSEDVRNLILPVSPKALSKAELEKISGGDYLAEATNVVSHAEAVMDVVAVQTTIGATSIVGAAEVAVVGALVLI